MAVINIVMVSRGSRAALLNLREERSLFRATFFSDALVNSRSLPLCRVRAQLNYR